MTHKLYEYFDRPYNFSRDMFSMHIDNWKKWLDHYVGRPDLNFLEVGTYEGASAFWLLEHILTGHKSRLTVIDLFVEDNSMRQPIWEVFNRNLECSGKAERVSVLRGRSDEILLKLPPKSFDFIYIDANHRGRDVISDGVIGWHLLKDNGILIFDDYSIHSFCPPELCTSFAVNSFVTLFRSEIKDLKKTDSQVMLVKKEMHFDGSDDRLDESYLCVNLGSRNYDWRNKQFLPIGLFSRDLSAQEISLIESAVWGISHGQYDIDAKKLKDDLHDIAGTSWEDIDLMGIGYRSKHFHS